MISKKQTISSAVHSFEPISDEFSHTLILGTMPSVQSRKAGFYYSHPRNRFWKVLSGCFKYQLPNTNADKINLLIENGIALWDVLASCEIIGSDDSTIKKPIYNDIDIFVNGKNISKILCNGKKAYNLCRRLDLPIPIRYVPSTSPANAIWSIEKLTEAWKLELI
ncbi:MAG: DNA-deoxyinosine glycosylase [Defluviitaleaceae bacterium]|nr:DNA-deoxyinosine glycosylase [Defluviitaleaceae bacterium]